MQNVYRLLRKLGMNSKYSGYDYFALAITFALSDSDYLRNVTKRLYVLIGNRYSVSPHCVESALRTLLKNYWIQYGDSILSQYLGHPFHDRPTTREFISILSDYLRDNPEF
ncbi:MAG: sporulation initiation factor Spo0A C-terminal domain-containing protein [Tyzzerella sp.]|nr:sporulation initiation factor Spo0A C-terminal domain-containing protein [Tyzzerella sp.]